MAKIKDLAVKTGTYTDKNGAEKGRYMNIGGLFEGRDGGTFMMLNRSFNPAGVPFKDGSDMIMVSMFDVKEKDGGVPAQHQSAPAPARSPTAPPDFDDDIPF